MSIASPLMQPSPIGRRVGVRIVTFEACLGFTHVTARRIAQPPYGVLCHEAPKAKRDRPEWRLAAAMLIQAAEDGVPVMLGEIAMRRALSNGRPVQPEPRRKCAKAYRVIR